MPSWSRLLLTTFWFSTRGISAQSFCTSQSGVLSGMSFWILPDLPLVFGRVVDIILRAVLSRKVCKTLAMNRSGGCYQHFPHLLSCASLLFSLSSMLPAWTPSALWFRWRFVSPFPSSHRRMLWCLRLGFRCSLGICLFFWVCWLQFAALQSWSLGFSSSHRCCCCAHQCCFHFHFLRFLVQIRLAHCRRIFFFEEFSKDIGNPFTRRDDFSFLIL